MPKMQGQRIRLKPAGLASLPLLAVLLPSYFPATSQKTRIIPAIPYGNCPRALPALPFHTPSVSSGHSAAIGERVLTL